MYIYVVTSRPFHMHMYMCMCMHMHMCMHMWCGCVRAELKLARGYISSGR